MAVINNCEASQATILAIVTAVVDDTGAKGELCNKERRAFVQVIIDIVRNVKQNCSCEA